MRVVIDTNVFISSFLGKGNPKKIIDLWGRGKITLCISAAIIEEYIIVLNRLSLSDEPELKELLELFASGYSLLYSHKPGNISLQIGDPDDIKFFECAVELSSDYIISGDKKVLQVREYLGTRVLSPADFMKMY